MFCTIGKSETGLRNAPVAAGSGKGVGLDRGFGFYLRDAMLMAVCALDATGILRFAFRRAFCFVFIESGS